MNTSLLIVAVLVVSAIGPVIVCLRVRDTPLSFHLAFQLILFVAYGLKAALIIHDPKQFVTYPYAWLGPYVWMTSVLIAAVGSMALSVSYVAMRDRLQYIAPRTPPPLNRYRAASAAMLVATLGAYLVLCRAAGIPPISADFYSPYRRTLFLTALAGNGILNVALLTLPVSAAPLLASGRILWRTLVLGTCIVVLGGVGNRTSLTGVLLIYVFGLAPHLVRAGWRQLTPLMAGLVFLTMLAGYKIQGQSGHNPLDVVKRYTVSFDGYDNMSAVLQADGHTPQHLGGSLLDDTFYAFIPRTIFPGKANFYGNTLLQQEIFPIQSQVFGTRATFPVSLYGEGFLSFGILGVLAFGAVAGLIAAFGNRMMQSIRSDGLTLQQTTALFLLGAAINLYRSLGLYLQLVFLAAIGCAALMLLRRAIDAAAGWIVQIWRPEERGVARVDT